MREGKRQRDAFEVYFRLGDGRSLQVLHAALQETDRQPSIRTLESWSVRFDWQARIATLEREAVTSQRERLEQTVREMNERQAREGLLLQQKGTAALSAKSTEDFSAADAIRAIGEGVRIERLSRGEATDRLNHSDGDEHDPRWEGFTDDDLERIRLQLERGEDPAGAAGTGTTTPG